VSAFRNLEPLFKSQGRLLNNQLFSVFAVFFVREISTESSSLVTSIKRSRPSGAASRKDLTPSLLSYGNLTIKLARHFGCCFGVENALTIAQRALDERGTRRVFLLSEMIHNPQVNERLLEQGVTFLRTTCGKELYPFSELTKDDIVIVPAFGVELEILERLREQGVETSQYDTTCPFVERVWKKARQLGESGYSLLLHGKAYHEETRATFSRAQQCAPTLIVRDGQEATLLASFILGKSPEEELRKVFQGKYSPEYNFSIHPYSVGVINQTTMLAEDTLEVSSIVRSALCERFGESEISRHFADTRDTLCYATSENQSSARALVANGADVALVIGGFKSSNTTHLRALCAQKIPSYHIEAASDILSLSEIRCYEPQWGAPRVSKEWCRRGASGEPIVMAVTAGASTPDEVVDVVIKRLQELFESIS
jgi:4-hydroxy-3-methylbut-2-en-1-yl diphosphate reductase